MTSVTADATGRQGRWPDGGPYLHEVAEGRCGLRDDGDRLHSWWHEKFHRVHFEQYARNVPAAVAEVTPVRPPYDYRSQRPGPLDRWRARRGAGPVPATAPGPADGSQPGREPKWADFREALVVWPPGPDFRELNDVLLDLSDLYLRASNYTDQEDAAFCHRLLRPALAECVSAYDSWQAPTAPAGSEQATPSPSGGLLSCLRTRHEEIEAIYRRCAIRRTVTHYAFGMLLGLVVLLPAFVAANALSFWVFERIVGVRLEAALVGSVHVGIALGAVGAASSVLLRITSSKVDLDYESTRHGWRGWDNPVIQRGAFRVAMGTIFGGMAAWFVQAGVLLPDAFQDALDHTSAFLVAGTIAYVAGFSERFIPDLIMRTARTGGAS